MTAAHPNPVVRALSIGWLLLKRPFLLPRVRKPSMEWVEETPIVVWPDILNPVVFRSGEWLARSLAELAPAGTDLQALDMGTGSGVSAIFAARLGYQVEQWTSIPKRFAVPGSMRLLNNQERRIEVIQGDLFAPAGRRKIRPDPVQSAVLSRQSEGPLRHGVARNRCPRTLRLRDCAMPSRRRVALWCSFRAMAMRRVCWRRLQKRA